MTIKGEPIEATHAEILHRPKGGRMYCRVLAGNAEDLSSKTAVWLEGSELRCGVDYMLTPGAQLSFGVQGENVVRIEFDEGVEGGGIAQMMMNVMAQGVRSLVRYVVQYACTHSCVLCLFDVPGACLQLGNSSGVHAGQREGQGQVLEVGQCIDNQGPHGDHAVATR